MLVFVENRSSCIKTVNSRTIYYWMNLVEVYQFRAIILVRYMGNWNNKIKTRGKTSNDTNG